MIKIVPIKIVTLRTEIRCTYEERTVLCRELMKDGYQQKDSPFGDFISALESSGEYKGYSIIVVNQDRKRHLEIMSKIYKILFDFKVDYFIENEKEISSL